MAGVALEPCGFHQIQHQRDIMRAEFRLARIGRIAQIGIPQLRNAAECILGVAVCDLSPDADRLAGGL